MAVIALRVLHPSIHLFRHICSMKFLPSVRLDGMGGYMSLLLGLYRVHLLCAFKGTYRPAEP